MSRLLKGLLVVGALSSLITLLMAWPVVQQPTQQIYGSEILGRNADPYNVIAQFGGADTDIRHTEQPLTDEVGASLAKVVPPIAAYNLVVLLSFPLSAMAAYALAWYLMGPGAGALVAALAFAFSPAHLAHAAYHPHIAQTQWLPLYVLALIALIDRLSLSRVVGLAVTAIALTLATFDGGLIGLMMAPAILAGFWAIRDDADHNLKPFLGAAGALLLIVASGAAWVWLWRADLIATARQSAVRLGEIGFYRGRWSAYVAPPVDHPVLGRWGKAMLAAADINLQLTEMQLYLGIALLLLSLFALGAAIVRWKSEPRWRFVPAALFVALTAVLISIGPTSGACAPASTAPACLIFNVAPMFRAYARFGFVAQLMLSLTAGAGVALLLATPQRRRLGLVLLAVAIFEYWPLPARAHDVLPTTAHRWLASSPDEGHVLDCYPGSATQAAIPWMMHRQVSFLGPDFDSCSDPQLGIKLAGVGVTRVLVRHGAAASTLPSPLPPGITLLRDFPDADLYAVSQTTPPVVTLSASGFFGLEHDGDDWWQWMSPAGAWIVRNTTSAPRSASLSLNLLSIGSPRRLTVTMDAEPPTTIQVGLEARDVTLGPWTLAPGAHTLRFVADGEPVRPVDANGSADRRPLTVSFRHERWN